MPSPESPPSAGRLLRASAVLSGLVACALWTGPGLFRPDRFSDDARQHVYWLYRFADPKLYPNDPSVAYFSSSSVTPWGYRGIYRVLAAHLDALFAAKLVAIALLLITLWLGWLIGVAVARRSVFAGRGHEALAGLLAVVTTAVIQPFVDLLPPAGFQRTFALPITMLCVWGLLAGRYLWVGISWILAALIYPVLIPVLGLTASLAFLGDLVRDRRMPSMWIWNGLLGVVAIAVALLESRTPAWLGPMVTGKQALAMPEFRHGGRQNLGLDDGWTGVFLSDRTGLGWSPYLLVAMAIAVAVALLVGSRSAVPGAVWTLVVVGVGLWLVARFTLFTLYLPNRHSRYSIAVLAIVAVSAAGLSVAARLSSKPGVLVRWAPLVAAAIAPIAVVAAFWPGAADELASETDHDKDRAAVFINHLPKDTLVAAHPKVANSVPLRTRRSVLASSEEWVAFMTGYNATMRPRIEASLRASYATSWQQFDAVLEPYGVDVFVVTPDMWEQQSYYAPYWVLTKQLRQAGEAKGFALKDPPADRVLFRSDDVYVLRVGPGAPQ